MEKGKIVFLNGVSSAGKTTLAKTLQARLNEPFYLLAHDIFLEMVPDKYRNPDGKSVKANAVSVMRHTVRIFSDMGLNVIIDDVLIKGFDWLDKYVELLHDYPVLFVHVTCPLEELRRREKERGDRDIGQGEEQLSILNPQNTYDITVDTFNNSREECADEIIKALNYPPKFTAFKALWVQHG